MTLNDAKLKACEESKKGYVQHVNRYWSKNRFPRPASIEYTVSDWSDSSTVVSYENGKEK